MKSEWNAIKEALKTRVAMVILGVLGSWVAQHPKVAAVLSAILGTATGQ
jgi:hypothetical protein